MKHYTDRYDDIRDQSGREGTIALFITIVPRILKIDFTTLGTLVSSDWFIKLSVQKF